jgi:hypothetical protein
MKRTVIVLKRLYNFLLLNPFRLYNNVYFNPFFEEMPKSCIQCTTKNWTISSRSSRRYPICKYNTSVAIYRETRLNKKIWTVRSRAKTLNPKHCRPSIMFELPVEGKWDLSIASESCRIAWTLGPLRKIQCVVRKKVVQSKQLGELGGYWRTYLPGKRKREVSGTQKFSRCSKQASQIDVCNSSESGLQKKFGSPAMEVSDSKRLRKCQIGNYTKHTEEKTKHRELIRIQL